MSAIVLEQTASHLTRQVRRWDRRSRVARSLVWVPRGLIAALVVGVLIALISRLRPWLLPEQIAVLTGGVALVLGLVVSGLIWLWPKPLARAARYFDRRFDLKERVSTALELSSGVIPVPEPLVEYQLTDAVGAVQDVDVAARLPVRVRYLELLVMVLLAVLVAYLLLSDNPQVNTLLAERELQSTINEQAAEIEETIEAIEQNDALTEEEKEALTAPLEEALEILQQPDISQQEAVAAMAEAGQKLREMTDGMLDGDEQAYELAADSLSGSPSASDLAQALKKPDLGAAAAAAEELANELAEETMSEEERQALANQLEQAADALEASNPALAEKLREAAQALRDGNMEAAQEALREAGEMLRQQEQQLQNSPLSQSAQSAMQQMNQGQQQIAQTGQQQQQQTGQQATNPQGGQQQQQAGQQQTGQQSQSQNPAGQQQGQSGQEQQSQQGQPQSGQQSQSQQQGAASQQSGMSEAQQAGAAQPGEGQSDSPGSNAGESGDESPGEGGSSQQTGPANPGGDQGANAPSAGEGEGGAGTNNTAGVEAELEGSISTDNSPGTTEGGPEEYTAQNPSSTIGGQSSANVDVGGQTNSADGSPIQEGEFTENPTGESSQSYTNVYGNYQDAVSDALESGRIPLDQRDVIHDYFSSLEP